MADSGNAGSPPKAPAHAAKPPAEMSVEPWEDDLSREITLHLGSSIERIGAYLGQPFAVTTPDSYLDAVRYLKERAGFDFLTDLTAVDYPQRERRFEIVCILYSFTRNLRVRVKASFADGAGVPSLTGIFPSANWLEREIFDMFGIRFDGHPALTRLLLPDEWQGHPLRKDTSIIGMDQEWVQQNLGIESGQ